MTLIRRIRTLIDNKRLADEQWKLLVSQRELIQELREAHYEDMNRAELEHNREMQGVVCGWLISLEKPEVDMRDTLVALENVLGHKIASIEEHLV
jgi:hypothetical protein